MTNRTSTADGRLGYPPAPRHRDAPNCGQRVSAPYRSGQSPDWLRIKNPGLGDRRALWVVLADSPTLAIETARTNGCHVDRIVGTLSEETVERLEIQPGLAKLL
jgi:hypothetical protein